MKTRSLYENELKDEFEQIKTIGIASDDHHKVVTDISQLTDRLVKLKEVENEEKKINNESRKIDIENQKVDVELARIDAEKEKAAIERSKIELEKRRIEIEERKAKNEERQIEEDRKDRLIKNVIAGLGVAIPSGITLTGMVLMFIFEEKGTILSKAGNQIVSRIFRAK